jgi:adenylosuccinate lyase
MIERYTLPEMGRIWSEAHKYELWFRAELLVLEAHGLPAAPDGRPSGRPRGGHRPDAGQTWDNQTSFRDSLLAEGKGRNMPIDEAALDRAFRAENYVARLGNVFEHLRRLT